MDNLTTQDADGTRKHLTFREVEEIDHSSLKHMTHDIMGILSSDHNDGRKLLALNKCVEIYKAGRYYSFQEANKARKEGRHGNH